MTRRPHTPLLRTLTADAACHGLSVIIQGCDERPWSSATFTGCRLTLNVTLTGGDPTLWLAGLPDADFAIPRYLVADIATPHAGPDGATIEVLLLEE